jgi:hypothetical protein
MNISIDSYDNTESEFTFDRSSTKSLHVLDSQDANNNFKLDSNKEYLQKGQLCDDSSFSIDDHNRAFIGFAIGLPLSLLLWTGIFSLLYFTIR